MRIAGVPFEGGPYGRGAQHPTSVVCHRTYGKWAGDMAVGRGARNGIGFHLLVGREPGQWCQFYDTAERCNHAAGGNTDSIGIEVTGTDAEPMTAWQVQALAQIVAALRDGDGIPVRHLPWGSGRVGSYHGYRDHAQVSGSTHTDGWTPADWARIVAHLDGDDDMLPGDRDALVEVRDNVRALVAAVDKLAEAVTLSLSETRDNVRKLVER